MSIIISASEKEDIENILSEHNGVAVLLLYKESTEVDISLLNLINHLSHETGVPVIKIDVEKATEFSKCTNITDKPSLAVISRSCENIIDYRSHANQEDAKEFFEIARELKVGGTKNQEAILGKEYNAVEND